MTFGGRDLKIPSGGDADFLGSSLQNCTRSGKRFHYKWTFFPHVQAVIWVGCALWQSHLAAADALPSHETHTFLFRSGVQQMGCVASAQLWSAELPADSTQSCHRQCWTWLHSLAEDPKTAKIPSKHPTLWVWSPKSYKPQPLCNSTTLKVLAGGNSKFLQILAKCMRDTPSQLYEWNTHEPWRSVD